jgi:hypothetical protein
MGLGGIVPHEPLQATEVTEPVEPELMPITGAKAKGTVLVADTRTVLHTSPAVGLHGIEQIAALHRKPV